jgi:hypothetical protein
LPVILRYVMGMLAVNLPVTGMLMTYRQFSVILALWIVTIVSGLATALSYWIDHTVDANERMDAAERDGAILRKAVDHDARNANA